MGSMAKKLWLGQPTKREDVDDILTMRFDGDFYAACEARWSMIQVEQLVLDQIEGEEDTPFMSYVTNRYWKDFAYQINNSLEMFGVVFWRTRKDRVYDQDDPVRKRLFGADAEKYPRITVPYVLPFNSYRFEITLDEDGRDVFKLTDRQTGHEMDDVIVTKGRRGCYRHDTKRFTTDCGAVLEAWRRYQHIVALHDRIAISSTIVEPYLEHRPLTDPTRLAMGAKKVETTLHEIDVHGHVVDDSVELKRVQGSENTIGYTQVPEGMIVAANQPQARITFDIMTERRNLKELYAAVLQLPVRFVLPEQGNSLRTDSEAAVSEDVTRTSIVVSERRNEIVDVLREAYFACYGKTDPNIHLPTKKSLKVESIYSFHDRGLMSDDVVREELASMTGIKIERFTTGPLPKAYKEDKKRKRPAPPVEKKEEDSDDEKKKKKKEETDDEKKKEETDEEEEEEKKKKPEEEKKKKKKKEETDDEEEEAKKKKKKKKRA